MEERRQSERIQARLQARWETDSGVVDGIIINCSVHGCFVLGEVEEPGNDPVRLTVRLPNGSSLLLLGTVAFHLPTLGFGLHFIYPSDEDKAMFDRWRVYVEAEKSAVPTISHPPRISAL